MDISSSQRYFLVGCFLLWGENAVADLIDINCVPAIGDGAHSGQESKGPKRCPKNPTHLELVQVIVKIGVYWVTTGRGRYLMLLRDSMEKRRTSEWT